MEHAIDSRTLEKFTCFLAFISNRGRKERSWAGEFKKFMKEGSGGKTCKACIKEYRERTRSSLNRA
ncbi:MAG: hypothetical protein R6V03_07860 [Kiritimatiellia bacterium]